MGIRDRPKVSNVNCCGYIDNIEAYGAHVVPFHNISSDWYHEHTSHTAMVREGDRSGKRVSVADAGGVFFLHSASPSASVGLLQHADRNIY